MAFHDDDMTYAVLEYARIHPDGKLVWKDIATWINGEDTRKTDPRLESLVGIRDYHFYRPVKRKNKKGESESTYRECKFQFDKINAVRTYAADVKIPNLLNAAPEKFLSMPISKQREAIIEMQQMCKKLYKDIAKADAKSYEMRIEEQYVKDLEKRVENLDVLLRRELEKRSKQLTYIMKRLNEVEAKAEMERYGITAEGIKRIPFVEALETQHGEALSIKVALKKYRNRGNVQTKGGIEDSKTVNGKVISWTDFNDSLFDDDEEDDDE